MRIIHQNGEDYLQLEGRDYWTSESLVKTKFDAVEIWYAQCRVAEKRVKELEKELDLLKNPPKEDFNPEMLL